MRAQEVHISLLENQAALLKEALENAREELRKANEGMLLPDEGSGYVRPSLLPQSLGDAVVDTVEYELEEVLVKMKESMPLKVAPQNSLYHQLGFA